MPISFVGTKAGDERVVKGNEQVIRARFTDARFFCTMKTGLCRSR
jgi:glycyl-tRNA synthetase beta subunit